IIEVGQQALATFMASIALAWGLGMVLDVTGRDWLTTTIANLAGFAGLVAVARLAKRYKTAKDERAAKPAIQPAE
ncbi:MAG: OpgC domain-containing protein, partial [Hyphomicrobiales bacterium]|nr:OpgC domain-containing protein [Hyphomicrobiales bacterium]